MGWKIHDYECGSCDRIEERLVSDTETPLCSHCGAGMKIIYLVAPHTDVYGAEQFDSHNEIYFSSESDRRKKMKALGFEPAPSADKHHGARNESHLDFKKRSYSFKGARCS